MSFNKNRSAPALHQICERLATMAYEVFTGKMAVGLKSIEYSYSTGRKHHTHVQFEAIFTPFENPDEDLVVVQFTAIPAYAETGKWCMEDGRVCHRHGWTPTGERMWRIGFADGPIMVIEHSVNALVFAGSDFNRSRADFSVSPEAEKSYLCI